MQMKLILVTFDLNQYLQNIIILICNQFKQWFDFFILFVVSLQNVMSFTLTAHVSFDQLHFKCSRVT